MNRREMLGALAGVLAAPAFAGLSAEDLVVLGRRVHTLLGEDPALRVLSPHQRRTVAVIAELIIPATDTPGATAARVDAFIDLILAEWYTDEQRAQFLTGLGDVDARSRQAFGRDFAACAETEQVAVMRALDAEVTALREGDGPAGDHFFAQMKGLTLHAYYTSEVGVTQELRYETIPGRYEGCVETPIEGLGGR